MNYGKQYSATPQLLNMMYTNLGRFGSFDDTNREVTLISNLEPTTMSMRDNHFNREASWLKYNGSNMQFCVVKYTRDGGGNLVGTVRTHNITSFPASLDGTFCGTKKISDSSYKLYRVVSETGDGTIDLALKCWTITLNNPDGEMPWTGAFTDNELDRITVSATGSLLFRVVGDKAFFTCDGGATNYLATADINAQTISADDFFNQTPVWQHDGVFGYKVVTEQIDTTFRETYYQRNTPKQVYEKLYGRIDMIYGAVDNFRQVTGDHFYHGHHKIFRRYLEGEFDDWWHISVENIDEAVTVYIEEEVAVGQLAAKLASVTDPLWPSHSMYHYMNKGNNAIVMSGPDDDGPFALTMYNITDGLGPVVDIPEGYEYYHNPLNCIDDASTNLYLLAINNTEHKMNLVEVGVDGGIVTNRVITTGTTSTFENELNAVNFGSFIFTWTNDTPGFVDGHLIYFSDDVDGASQVIMLPEIQ